VLLDKAGSINRLGDGTPSQADKTLYIGVVREPLFDELMDVVPDPIFRYAGRMEVRERRGVECLLTEAFFHKDGRVIPFEVLYGSESQGPPSELVTIVKRAIELTDPGGMTNHVAPDGTLTIVARGLSIFPITTEQQAETGLPGLIYTRGLVVLRLNPDGSAELIRQQGTLISLCAELQ
jgi:hypothetical protein